MQAMLPADFSIKQAAIAELENKAAVEEEPGSKDAPEAEENKDSKEAENASGVNDGVYDGTTPPPVAYKPIDISL